MPRVRARARTRMRVQEHVQLPPLHAPCPRLRCARTLPAASPRPHLAAVDNPHWAEAGIACYEGGHLAQAVISGVLSVAFVALCALFSLVIYDSNSIC